VRIRVAPRLSLVTLASLGTLFFCQVTLAQLSPSLSLETGPETSAETATLSVRDQEVISLLEQGARHEHGEGVAKDPAEAQRSYCRAMALGSTDAMVRLAWMYANGRGVNRDDAVAAGLLREAAKQGNPMAERLTGMIKSDIVKDSPCPKQTVARNTTRVTVGGSAPSAANEKPIQLGIPAEFRKPMSSIEQKKVIQAVLRLSSQFRLDPRLVIAVITQESSFDPTARSNKNAQGLMQLIPETAERFAVKDPFDPMENIRGGMAYLRWLLAYFRGDVGLVLAAYNAGEGSVDKYRGIPPFAETIAYVQRIKALYPLDKHPFDAKVTSGRVTSIR
jgi:Transglycosylase SLT domain